MPISKYAYITNCTGTVDGNKIKINADFKNIKDLSWISFPVPRLSLGLLHRKQTEIALKPLGVRIDQLRLNRQNAVPLIDFIMTLHLKRRLGDDEKVLRKSGSDPHDYTLENMELQIIDNKGNVLSATPALEAT